MNLHGTEDWAYWDQIRTETNEPNHEEQDATQEWQDLYGHAERMWQE